MQFEIAKLIDILTTFAKNNQELTKLRINKLLYFIDKIHLQKYGRFVLNDRYHRLGMGPIPSLTSDLLNEFFDPDFSFSKKYTKSKKNVLRNYFKQGKLRNKHDLLILKKESNLESLSQSEVEVIEEILKTYGKLKTGQLIEESHKEATWKQTNEQEEISYELFLDGLSEKRTEAIRNLIEIDQEHIRTDIFLNK